MKQIKFGDLDNGTTHAGILLDNGDVICGCCGSLIDAERFHKSGDYELIEELDWSDLTEAIL